MSEDKEEVRKFNCNLCGKTFEFCGRCYVGNLGKEGVANDDPLVVDFRGGRFDGNAYLLDPVPMYAKAQTDEHGIRWLAACGDCLEAMVESGELKRKPLQKCLTCGSEFQDSHGFDGSDVEADGKTVFGYGSVSADGDIRRIKLPQGWHCYPCLDKEVREGRSEFMKAYMFLNDLRDDQPKDSLETYKQLLHQARHDVAITRKTVQRMRAELEARGVQFAKQDELEGPKPTQELKDYKRVLNQARLDISDVLRCVELMLRGLKEKKVEILGNNTEDPILDNARLMVMLRFRFAATVRTITDVLGPDAAGFASAGPETEGDIVVNSARLLACWVPHLKWTESQITEILGDADKWKDGESAS